MRKLYIAGTMSAVIFIQNSQEDVDLMLCSDKTLSEL